MDPLTISAIGLGVQAAGGLINFLSGKSAADRAATLADENFQRWMAIQLPNPEDQKLALKQLTSAGKLSPQLEQQLNQVNTELGKVVTDPQTQAAQMNALNALQQEGYHGGLSLQDQAILQDAQVQNQDQARGNSAAIMQNLAQRGASNSGFGVAAQLSNAQNSANQNARSGLSAAGAAQQRALEAIQGAGSLAGTIQQNSLNQQNTVANSQDAINRFNTANAQNVQQRNVNSLNAAQAANLGNAQRISDANTGLSNDEQIYNKGLIQQNYNNQITQAKGASALTGDQAAAAKQQSDNTGNFATNLSNQIGGAAATKASQDWWTNYQKSQQQPATATAPAPTSGLNPKNQAAVDRIKSQVDNEDEQYN